MIDKKEYMENKAFLTERFNADGLEAPETLSAEALMQRLEAASAETMEAENSGAESTAEIAAAAGTGRADETPRTEKPQTSKPLPKRRWFRPVISIAACAALVIGLVPLMKSALPSGSTEAGGLESYSSYSELNGKVKEMIGESPSHMAVTSGGFASAKGEDMADAESYEADAPLSENAEAPQTAAPNAAMEDNAGGGESADPDHSETYTQVEGVDEADIVKTDGKYIYYTSYMENQIIIAKAQNGKTKRVAAINASQTGSYVQDMYVHDGRLIVIGCDYGGYDAICYGEDTGVIRPNTFRDQFHEMDRETTSVTIFDITDPENPRQLNQYTQTGSLLSSRMIGPQLCLVTNDHLYQYKKKYCVPYVCYDGETPVRLDIENICGIPHAISPAYTVIGCIDTNAKKAGQSTIKTKAVLGGSQEIYCNGTNLYVAADVSERTEEDGYYYAADFKTCILKVSIKDGKVKYQKTATIDGSVNNQFSMDESHGYFKVAVTEYVGEEDTNNLYVMDENMKIVGSVRNFAPGEHIEAVRYIKDKAYVITYQETDPLFIIDLKDPTNPVIEGHVKITGFSTLLVPADEDHLLGLGFSTEENEFGEATDGVKLSLFDISDPLQPAVADFREFSGMDSEVQYNHKALLVGPDTSYYAFPYDIWYDETDDDPDGGFEYGIEVFSAKNGKLGHFKSHETKEAVQRCIYIGDYIYGICDDDSIEGFKVK